ncbi:metabolite traffic protein EboE [Embleya scabrispora]|uniref:metabolite traffic protein EboE n=1 Tax=Embleya scabrispora TaxID=159449 RepID=UPI00036859DD|nr:metabolite traffic protein EboE [Embleya scabrispora]MYS80604.1 metabolite traffic protein EboE [Streptomyces sp. SID5474]
MRFRHPDGTLVHAAYCTNVHAAEDLAGVLHQLAVYCEPIRERLDVATLGVGLWLARPVATSLVEDPMSVDRLRRALAERGLEVVTLNAFPYTGFQHEVVKKAVYSPDWADPARLEYTLDCSRLLARLLPDDAARGSVSTLPLAWREPWPVERADAARRALDDLAAGLERIEADYGRRIRVGLEPEPGCVLETTDQAAAALRGTDPHRIGVCFDTCHLAVGFEDPAAALDTLAAAAIPVVKAQAACALHAEDPHTQATAKALRAYAEPRFLHQTREERATTQKTPLAVDDLPDALAGGLPGLRPWRVHYHLPLHGVPPAPLTATHDVLDRAIEALFGGPVARTDHVEVETYTWPVLDRDGPPTRDTLVAGIAAELDRLRTGLLDLGLKSAERKGI